MQMLGIVQCKLENYGFKRVKIADLMIQKIIFFVMFYVGNKI